MKRVVKSLTLILLAATICSGCGDTTGTDNGPHAAGVMADQLDQLVAALAAFAAENDGNYPRTMASETPLGNSLAHFLPNGELLVNVYTHEPSEPGVCADPAPGRLIYIPAVEVYSDTDPWPVPGYIVTGYMVAGPIRDSLTVVTERTAGPDSLHMRDALVITNCLLVHDAVAEWATASTDPYPGSVGQENDNGDNIVDLLPGRRLLTNPYHGLQTEPINGVAAAWGQTGYVPKGDGFGAVIGYTITGYLYCGDTFQIDEP